jgi:amidase
MPSTWGVPELIDNRPVRNALAVDRFLDAGAVVFGKTNVAAYLIGWDTSNEVYGATANPWALDRSPGGASGGATAALAAGLTALDIGVDFGGGVRNVAHYCGVFGHKPTYGVTNLVGHVMPGIGPRPDIAVAGPMARSADDLELALTLMAGPNPTEEAAWRLALPPPRRDSLRGLRVAVMAEERDFPVDDEVRERIEAVARFLAEAGAEVDEVARPAIDPAAAFRVFGGLLLGGISMRQSDERFWGKIAHLTRRFFPEAEDPGRHVMSHAEWLKLDTARHLLRRAWAEFFTEFDVLLCPAAPTVALPRDPAHDWHQRRISIKGRTTSMADPTFWGGYTSVAHLPSTVAPAGSSPEGLPVGVQIVGPEYGDLTCIAVAREIERSFRPFAPPPGYN